MNLRFNIALLAMMAFAPFFAPGVALADAGQQFAAGTTLAPLEVQATQACATPLERKLNLAQTTQTECCKDHKGICGCRAGQIVCCDGTASTSCTCHGEDGFIQ
mgnify:CR=1 FL=1